MATVKSNYSPMHINCKVGYPYGVKDSGYTCGFHTGCDFPESGAGEKNPNLYSISPNGNVVYVYKESTGTTPALGNQVQIYDTRTGLYYRYCHLLYGSIKLNVGDKVDINTIIGKMGNTGNSTGTHLHLEATTRQEWNCANFVDPVAPLGIPNIRGTIVEFTGDTPKPPQDPLKKRPFKWVLYAKKLRK